MLQGLQESTQSLVEQIQDQIQEVIHQAQKTQQQRRRAKNWQHFQDQVQDLIHQVQELQRRRDPRQWRYRYSDNRDNVGGPNVLLLVLGVGVGAALMYMLDPRQGKRRRALVRDRLIGVSHDVREQVSQLEGKSEYVADQLRGAVAEAKSHIQNEPIDDYVLVERVRSHFGRLLSHPRAVEVEVTDGRVTLRGDILTDELEPLLEHLRSMRGVEEIDNRLHTHWSSEAIMAALGRGQSSGTPTPPPNGMPQK